MLSDFIDPDIALLSRRIDRIEAYLGFKPAPNGWITMEKINQLRDKHGIGMEEAKKLLIKYYGEVPENETIWQLLNHNG